MLEQPIQTSEQIIRVDGKVFYSDGRRRIDLKRPIRDLFEHSGLDIGYSMELCLTGQQAVERMRQLTGTNVRPIILYFFIRRATKDERQMP